MGVRVYLGPEKRERLVKIIDYLVIKKRMNLTEIAEAVFYHPLNKLIQKDILSNISSIYYQVRRVTPNTTLLDDRARKNLNANLETVTKDSPGEGYHWRKLLASSDHYDDD